MAKLGNVGVSRVIVEKLFGLYDYDLKKSEDAGNILILYGDNGSGKTTILKLIFHLLSTEKSGGHKTFIANTKFKSVEVILANKYSIFAKRRDTTVGTYDLGINMNKRNICKIEMKANERNAIVMGEGSKEEINYHLFLDKIKEMKIGLYLMTDNRQIFMDRDQTGSITRRTTLEDFFMEENLSRRIHREGESIDPEKITVWLLESSLERASSWVRSRVMRATSKGDSSVNTLYSGIISSIVATTKTQKDSKEFKQNKEQIFQRISEIETRSREFSKFGLIPAFNGTKLKEAIKTAKKNALPIIKNMLDPYLESIDAKLKALKNIQDLIEKITSTLNSFLVNKKIHLDTVHGFDIKSIHNEKLTASMLSSGEKHLLLLFCNSVIALDKPTIFIIDEPEISLNVKWQRRLVDSLIRITRGSQIQYIFATHSIELITKHKDKVVKLAQKSS